LLSTHSCVPRFIQLCLGGCLIIERSLKQAAYGRPNVNNHFELNPVVLSRSLIICLIFSFLPRPTLPDFLLQEFGLNVT
jgi:hypothetical protein